MAVISHAIGTMLKSSHTYYKSWDKTMPDWPSYTIKEASEKTGYNEEHLRRLIRQGKIQATKVGPTYLIHAESLDKYMADIQDTDDARVGPRKKRK